MKSKRSQEQGSAGFSDHYWETNYKDSEEMDGIGNAREHALYLKQLFGLEFIDISSVFDLGAGMGHLFEAVLKEFVPYKAIACEPSDYAFKALKKRELKPVASTRLELHQMDAITWANSGGKFEKIVDLTLCTSVFQYLTEEEIDELLPTLAARTRYLYLTVPTDVELKRQREDLDFDDQYAIARTRAFYQRKLKPHFTFVAHRLLESKVHFDEGTTSFTDLLFRF